jgi:hypothetical protein
MFRIKSTLTSAVAIALLELTPIATPAESVKMVQWWDAYFPPKDLTSSINYRSTAPFSVQYQDVDHDNVYNDAVVWYEFSTKYPLNPLAPGEAENKSWQRYRINRPSARFYGGMVARFTNVSQITQKDKKGNPIPVFNRFQQATVQQTEGRAPCSYSTAYPHQSGRGWESPDYSGQTWADMTIMVVNKGGSCCPFSEQFQKAKKAQVNFTTVFLWKKEDFLNGGAAADQIIFDNTSKLSVDVTRFRKNVEETRFIVQDGNQLWISEGATQDVVGPDDQAGETSWAGKQGIQVENFKFGGVTVTLNPLNSRWTIYTPAADEGEMKALLEKLQKMNFNPKKATPEAKQAYQDQSNQLLNAINQMEFNATTANFVEHTFADVQAVGVYFATYPFAHKITQLVFDNFQAFATGNIPKGKAVAADSQGNSSTTDTQLTGGISVNCGPFEQRVNQCLCDAVKVRGDLTVAPADVGKQADIVVYAAYKESPEAEQEVIYMLDTNSGVHLWDKKPENLLPFKEQVTLQADQVVELYQGQFPLAGFLQIFFGYRLPDGTVVTNADSINVTINNISNDKANEMPYCESIKNQCSSEQ